LASVSVASRLEPENSSMTNVRKATLYRMVLPDHTCPYGVEAKTLLEENGYDIEEHVLGSRDEVEAFKSAQGVSSTPQVFIAGERIGGSDALAEYLAMA
jgi:glutaredoxin